MHALVLATSLVLATACGAAAPTTAAGDDVAADTKVDTFSNTQSDALSPVDAAVEVASDATLWSAVAVKTDPVSFWYSQGLAKVSTGWVFSHAGALYRTDAPFVQIMEHIEPLPALLYQKKFLHIGDIDALGDVVYAGLEQQDYAKNEQAVAWFDAETLTCQGYQFVAQRQFAWVSIEPTPTTAYAMNDYSDDTVLRYDAAVPGQWKLLSPLKLSRKVNKVQGGDVALGALWLSTDDDHHGLYRADLKTGDVQEVGTLGHNNGFNLGKPEGEGIDATLIDGALLHTLTGEPLKLTSWVDHFVVTPPAVP